jgi:small GTP-binding protein
LKKVILQIWDTAGQEKFRALTQSYFRSSQGCICVYDINQPETFEKVENYLKDAFEYKIRPECIFLLSNKCDECHNESADATGKDLANKYGINFLKVSAKTGEGMGDFVGNLATKIDNSFSAHNKLD